MTNPGPQPDPPAGKSSASRDAASPDHLAAIVVTLIIGAIIAGGVWLFNAIDASKKAQECLESRRRNCTIIETPR